MTGVGSLPSPAAHREEADANDNSIKTLCGHTDAVLSVDFDAPAQLLVPSLVSLSLSLFLFLTYSVSPYVSSDFRLGGPNGEGVGFAARSPHSLAAWPHGYSSHRNFHSFRPYSSSFPADASKDG
jgi:hypothetical protein